MGCGSHPVSTGGRSAYSRAVTLPSVAPIAPESAVRATTTMSAMTASTTPYSAIV